MKINFIPLNQQEKDLLTKKAVAKMIEKRFGKMLFSSIKQKQIIRKYESLIS